MTGALPWPYLERLLEERPDGRLGLRAAPMRSTVVWWEKHERPMLKEA
ncbi:MAG TPA: hypothetical protein VHB98_01235 [Chloroflexota bacterium]|nr:hypothetical protein [Chloroflexota bacterium]